MDLWRNTVVVFTADHGEMGGAHGGLKGKGPFSYEANAHVPLLIAHPAGKAGAATTALTSHIDVLPTFAGLTGLPDANRPAAVKALPGRDFSGLLVDPEKASVQTVRPGVLFNYVGVSTVDSDYLTKVMSSLALRQPNPPVTQAKLDNRGFLSFVFGRPAYRAGSHAMVKVGPGRPWYSEHSAITVCAATIPARTGITRRSVGPTVSRL
jgi:arylsulfatase